MYIYIISTVPVRSRKRLQPHCVAWNRSAAAAATPRHPDTCAQHPQSLN